MSVNYDMRYRKGWAYGKEPSKWLKAAAEQHLPNTDSNNDNHGPSCILSLGEGQGRNATYLATLGHHVMAVDASQVGLNKTCLLAEQRGVSHLVETFQVDLEASFFDPGLKHGARWQAVVSVFCALPPEPRRIIHRACFDAIIPGGLFFYEGFTFSDAALDSIRGSHNGSDDDSILRAGTMKRSGHSLSSSSGEELTKTQQSRPQFLAGPKDPTLLANPATLLEELEGLEFDVLQAEVISVDELNDGPFHRGPARLTHLVLRKRDNQIPHSQVKPRPLDDNTATIIKHEQPEPPRAFDESDISATLIKALCDESTGDDEYRMAIDSVFEGASELRAAAAHELRALIPVGSMVGTNDDGRDSNSDDRRFHMGLSGEDKFAEAMDVYLARTAVATLSSSTATIETTTPTPTMPSIDDSLSNICSITRSTLNGCVVGIASGVDCGSNSNDVTTTSPPVKKSQRSGRSGGNKRRGRDPLLACAGTSVAIACGATTRATPQRCRYCWLPFSAAVDAAKTRDACMCGELASLKKAHKEEQFKLMPSNFCVRNEAPLSMPYASPRAAASTQVWPRVHFVVVCHPNEFMRSTSTAKIATTLLGNTGNTNPAISSCSMLVVGAPRHEARLNALLSAAALDADDNDHKRAKSEDHTNAACRDGELGRVRVLFPWSENEDDSVANALTFGKVQLRAAAPNIECLPQDDDGSSCIWHSNNLPVLTVLVPDGSWACATALVAQLDRKVRDIQASNFLTASDGDSVENFVEDDDNGGGSGRETDKKKNSNSNDVLPLNQGLKFVRLCRERVASHHSPLIEALRAGCGNGRLSTLEAMAMFLDEAAQAASGHDTVPTVDSAAPSAMLDSAPIEATSRVAPTAVPTYPSVENIENAELAGWYTPSQWAHLASSDAQLLRSGLQPLVRHVQRENKVLRAAVAVGTTDGSATTSSSTFREGTSHDKVGASMYGEISKTYPRSKITGQKNDTKHVLASWVTALEATATAREKHAVSAQAATSNSIDIPTVAAATEAAVTSAAAHPHWAGAPGLRRCIVCGAALSTPLRWRAHLSGKKHLEAVARKHLVGAATRSGGATSGDAPVEVEALRSGPPRERNVPTTKECEAALALHSDAPLNENSWLVEPPDVALAAVAGALSLRSF